MKKIILVACTVVLISVCGNTAVAADTNKAPIGSLTCYDFQGDVVEYKAPYSNRMVTSFTDTEGVERETSHPCTFTKYKK